MKNEDILHLAKFLGIDLRYEEPENATTLTSWTQTKQKEYRENNKSDAKALFNI